MSSFLSPELQKRIKELVGNRWAIGCLAVGGLQQILESSSTFWLVTLSQKIVTGSNYFPFLIIYLTFLLIPYIPNCIGLILKAHWKQEAQRSFVQSFINSNQNNINEWNNKGKREEKISILTSEGPYSLHLFIDYIWELYTYVLSVFFNIIALSVVVEPLFLFSYGISIVCVIIIMRLKRKRQRQLTQKALIARVDLSQSLLASWDNVLLGNAYNFKLWYEKTFQRLNRCLQRNVDLERFDQILAISVAFITSIPSLCVVIWCMLKNSDDIVQLTSYVVILPLLLQILSSIAFRWGMHRSRLASIYRVIEAKDRNIIPYEEKIKWPKITATFSRYIEDRIPRSISQTMESSTDLLNYTTQSGRLTIRGENGCGKSSALMLVKNTLSNRAFLLPTHNHLSFCSITHRYSTGESLRNRLTEILEKVDVDVLLLDEWDANLDTKNQEILSSLIDKLAEKKCVIEVRHR